MCEDAEDKAKINSFSPVHSNIHTGCGGSVFTGGQLTIEWSLVRIPLSPLGNFVNFRYPTLPVTLAVSFGKDTKIRSSLQRTD